MLNKSKTQMEKAMIYPIQVTHFAYAAQSAAAAAAAGRLVVLVGGHAC
jgi:hypothetical protein